MSEKTKTLKSLKFHGLEDIYKIPSTAEDVGAATLEQVNEATRKAAYRNLLDNSDFRNPVNQRGQNVYTEGYTIDRWRIWDDASGGTLKVSDRGIQITRNANHDVVMVQMIPIDSIDITKTYSFVAYKSNDPKVIQHRKFTDSGEGYVLFEQVITEDVEFSCFALYEGEYTEDTIPEYQPKGYEQELLVCKQYDPTTGEYIGLRKFSQPRNILDNSYFRNPVNQKGQGVYTSFGYTIDRWLKESESTITLTNGGIHIDNEENSETECFIQKTDIKTVNHLMGKTVTLAIKTTEGIFCGSGTVVKRADVARIEGDGWVLVLKFFMEEESYQTARLIVYQGKKLSVEWIALYEGVYTIDTLPEYQPKGYETELLVCRQYDPITGKYIGLQKFSQPRNLLDNSDFSNLVNQRCKDTYSSGYGFDRWRIYAPNTSMEKKDGYIAVTGAGIWQNVPNVGGKIYTLAAQKVGGQIYACSGKFENGVATAGGELMFNFVSTQYNSIFLAAGDWVWVALYEGEYTIDTLPKYQPKGYGAELAECQRYYVEYDFYESFNLGKTYSEDARKADIYFNTPCNLIDATPSIIIDPLDTYIIIIDGVNYTGALATGSATASGNTVNMVFMANEDMPLNTQCMLRMIGKFALSADI